METSLKQIQQSLRIRRRDFHYKLLLEQLQ